MKKTILLTGATDGIGLETAKMFVRQGHRVLLHGRNQDKLAKLESELLELSNEATLDVFKADLADLNEVTALANNIHQRYDHIDVVINNAGVFKSAESTTVHGLDIRFVVNTIAPYILTKHLLPIMDASCRVVNLSSAAQAPVNLNVFNGSVTLGDSEAYAQSKLALTMWSIHLAKSLGNSGPAVIAVNPASLLGSKMVKDAYGVKGGDLKIGADILYRAALSEEFADASGKYYDNDKQRFTSPHADALNAQVVENVMRELESVSRRFLRS